MGKADSGASRFAAEVRKEIDVAAPVEPQPTPTPPDEEPQLSASLEGLPPSSNPANWVDHED